MTKALIVEDSELSQFLIKKYLIDTGVKVVSQTSNGEQAVRLYKRHKPNLVFIDILVEGIDGIETAKKIRDYDQNAHIIICSALGDAEHIQKAAEIGIFDYVLKPFSGMRIKEIVDNYTVMKNISKKKRTKKGYKILIVDDSRITCLLLKKSLEACGAKVISEASNGREAVSRYKEEKPDIILMDIVMPIMDGISATKEILKIDKNAKIGVITSMNNLFSIKEAFKAGAKDYIIKPFKTIDIQNMLEYLNQP